MLGRLSLKLTDRSWHRAPHGHLARPMVAPPTAARAAVATTTTHLETELGRLIRSAMQTDLENFHVRKETSMQRCAFSRIELEAAFQSRPAGAKHPSCDLCVGEGEGGKEEAGRFLLTSSPTPLPNT